jgi:MFS family permease
MFISRMMVGIGEAVLSPAAFSIIGDSFEPARRAKPIAFYSAALVIASSLTGFIIAALLGMAEGSVYRLPLIGEVPSWQFIFFCVGAPGLFVAIIFLILKDAPRTESLQKSDEKLSDAFVFVGNRLPVLLSFVTIFVTMVAIAYAQFNWLPETFERTFGEEEWSRKSYAARNATLTLIVGLSTYFLSGIISDWWSSKGERAAPLLLSIIGLLIMVPACIIGPLMPNGWAAFALLNGLGTVGIGMVSCTGVTALLQIVPGNVRGTVVALYYMTISFVGGFISPPLVGWMSSEVFGETNLNIAMACLPAIFGIPAILLLPFTLRWYRREVAEVDKLIANSAT